MKYSTSSKILAVAAIILIGNILAVSIKSSDDVPSAILEAMKDKDPVTFFRAYMIAFRKTYSFESEEGQKRFKIFKQSLENIKKYNQKHGGKTKFGITPLSDMSEEEYLKPIEQHLKSTQKDLSHVSPTIENGRFEPIDWRTTIPFSTRPGWGRDGYQHMCYQVLFAYEAANALATGTYTALSAPQAINCLNLNQPYTYMNDKGLFAEKDYPTPEQWWTMISSTCEDTQKTGKTYKISAIAFTNLKGRPESPLIRRSTKDLYSYLKRGPVMVSFSASWDAFQNYKGGIFTSDEPCSSCARCSRSRIGLLVGYGIDSETNTDYWILKFHKGNDWGENGSYMRLARNESALNYGLSCHWKQPVA